MSATQANTLPSSFFSCSAEDYFDPQPSWFDTLSNNNGCLQIDMYPVRAKDLDANKTSGSSAKHAKISKSTEGKAEARDICCPLKPAD